MNFDWSFFIDFGIVSFALLAATLLRGGIRFFQRFLIPNALTAGFLLLVLYNFAGPHIGLDPDHLGVLVYHLLSISFVAMVLRPSESGAGRARGGTLRFAVAVLFQYGSQAFIGLMLTVAFIATIVPDLFPAFGFLLPLGFGLGPGQAYSIGSGWEAFGFVGAGSVGLTFAAVGFLLACFAGVFMVNYGLRRGWLGSDVAQVGQAGPGIRPAGSERPPGSHLTTDSDAIDTMSLNLALVMGVYLLSYLFLVFVSRLLALAGDLGADLANNLWGINFIFATIIALGVKQLVRALGWSHAVDAGSLTRISGTAVDVTVAAAIGAISLVVVGRYWLPIVVISVVAAAFVFVSAPWMASRLFTDHRFHRALVLFGAMTGTLPTGLALLRVIDPEFRTPVATDYVYSAAIVFVFAIPLILAMNLPAYAVSRGQPSLVWVAAGIVAGYAVAAFVAYVLLARGRGFRKLGRLWLEERPRADR